MVLCDIFLANTSMDICCSLLLNRLENTYVMHCMLIIHIYIILARYFRHLILIG